MGLEVAPLPKVSKDTLLKLIDGLKENPSDKLRVLGDVGIVSLAATGGQVASVAAIAGINSVFGLSTAAQLFGWMSVLGLGAPPMAFVLACASGLGLLAYAITRLIHGGGVAEGRKAELLEKYVDQVKAIEAKGQAALVTDVDRTQFILSLREIIDADAIPIDSAFRMIEMVEAGRMPLSQAVSLTKACLETKPLKPPKQFSR
jgi:hypothetical protein